VLSNQDATGGCERSLDHLARARDQRVGDVDAERPCGLQVDAEVDPGHLLDGQVRGLLALENAAGVAARLAERIRDAAAIADRAARGGRRSLGPSAQRYWMTTLRPSNVQFGGGFEIRPARSPRVIGGVTKSLRATPAARVGGTRHPVLTDINVAGRRRARNRVAEFPASRVRQPMDWRPGRGRDW